MVTEEANAIGTAYLRIALLPADKQPAIRAVFRQYVEARIALYKKYSDTKAYLEEYLRGIELQVKLWTLTVDAVYISRSPPVAGQIITALNNMIDITTTGLVATRTHPPKIIHTMLYGLALLVSMLAGYGMSSIKIRLWLHVIAFSIAFTVIIYVIIDIEYPRSGFIRLDYVCQLLVDELNSMK